MQLFAAAIDGGFIKTGDKQLLRTQFLETILGQDAVRRIQYTAYKKPFIPGGQHFSLSHSGQWLFLALAETPVGADIERHKPNRDFAGIARRVFSEAEYEAVLRAEDRLQAFYDQWVRKESYLKMRGTGFFVDDNETETDSAIRLYPQFPGYSAAVACRPGTDWPQEVFFVTLAAL